MTGIMNIQLGLKLGQMDYTQPRVNGQTEVSNPLKGFPFEFKGEDDLPQRERYQRTTTSIYDPYQ